MSAVLSIRQEEFLVRFSLAGVPEAQHFVGRAQELTHLKEEFQGDGSERKVVILQGLGGIGKTQLAVAFAKEHRSAYSAIFWLKGKDEDTLKQSLTKVARRIYDEHPSSVLMKRAFETNDTNRIVDAVKAWLSIRRNFRWMLVFDNVDDPQAYDINTYLPEAHQGSILVTTRSSQLHVGAAVPMPLGKLVDAQESIAILAHTSARSISSKGLHRPNSSSLLS